MQSNGTGGRTNIRPHHVYIAVRPSHVSIAFYTPISQSFSHHKVYPMLHSLLYLVYTLHCYNIYLSFVSKLIVFVFLIWFAQCCIYFFFIVLKFKFSTTKNYKPKITSGEKNRFEPGMFYYLAECFYSVSIAKLILSNNKINYI